MSEHWIRLRAAWMGQWLREDRSWSGRVDLPARWLDLEEVPDRLVRGFQSPRRLLDSESLVLRLERVPGLRLLQLNGEKMPWRAVAGGFEVELPQQLPRRSQLLLELDPRACLDDRDECPSGWGAIALVVRDSQVSAGSDDDPPVL